MKLCQENEKVTKMLKDSLWSDKKVHFHLRQKQVILNKDRGTENTESEKKTAKHLH